MFKTIAKNTGHGPVLLGFCILAVLGGSLSLSAQSADKTGEPKKPTELWDPAGYIGLDEIKPGMEGYCLTEYGVGGVEKFALKVVDVVRDFEPKRDIILVEGTDDRFIHTGPVAGCSGSPVYLDGRLAGALAYAWTNSKDPLYGATAIADMLQIGRGQAAEPEPAYTFDYSKPIDFAQIDRQITSPTSVHKSSLDGVTTLPCPLIASGLPIQACEQLSAAVKPFGLVVMPGLGAGAAWSAEGAGNAGGGDEKKRELTPGACLAVPLVTGDMTMAVYGTVTEVRDGTVYGFGHPFMGYGAVDLPMATGRVHTVISSMVRSSKLARVVQTVGALTADEGAGILGKIGAEARMFPLTMRVDRYNDQKRVYNCRVVSNRMLTASLIRSIISGAASYLGDLPPDHTIEYKASVAIEGFEPIIFENVSTSLGVLQMSVETSGAIALLMNNPYEKASVESVEIDLRIIPKDITSHIWSANLSDSRVKAGERIAIDVVIESVRADKRKYRLDLEIPEDLRPGKYELTLCGSQDYEQFLVKVVPYKFVGQTLPDLVEALRDTLKVKRDKLYCYLVLPSGGITLEKAELPDLPATKSLILQSAKRPMSVRLHPHWQEQTLDTGTVVINKRTMQITVEK